MAHQIRYLCVFFAMYTACTPPESTTHSHKIEITGSGPVTVPVNVNVGIEPRINPSINMEPQNLFQPGNTIHTSCQSASISQSVSTATNVAVNRIKMFMMQQIQRLKAVSPRAMGQSLFKWVILHKKRIMLYSAGVSYVLISILLIRGYLFIRRTETWASFKKHLSMEELLALPQDQLGKELIHTIQQRHVNTQNPTDHITPLVRFVQAVDQEMKCLNQYLMIATIIQRCRLMWIFPINRNILEQARELKQRLLFVKHIFISWTATDNLANFNH